MDERDIVIVGAGPAGLSAGIFAKLDGWSTLLLEGNWVGGQGDIAYTVTNYPGFPPGDGAILIENMRTQVTSPPPDGVGAELRYEKAVGLDPESLIVTTEAQQYRANAIILATGSRMQELGVPGEQKFLGKGVSYYAKRDLDKFSGKNVLVVGGGNTTAKSALLAKSTAAEVTLVHRRQWLRAYPAMVARLQKAGVQIRYNTEVNEIQGDHKVESVVLEDNQTGEKDELAIDWVVICVGTEPDPSLAREAGIEMAGNFVRVDGRMMTSKEGVLACGEVAGCDRHIVSSAAHGAAAGMAASEYLALEKVRKGEMFEGTKNGKYADEYLAALRR
jgi:thioredoxin reductase (NADPH)